MQPNFCDRVRVQQRMRKVNDETEAPLGGDMHSYAEMYCALVEEECIKSDTKQNILHCFDSCSVISHC